MGGPCINKGIDLVEVAAGRVTNLNLRCKRPHARPLVSLLHVHILASLARVGQTDGHGEIGSNLDDIQELLDRLEPMLQTALV